MKLGWTQMQSHVCVQDGMLIGLVGQAWLSPVCRAVAKQVQ